MTIKKAITDKQLGARSRVQVDFSNHTEAFAKLEGIAKDNDLTID